MSTPLTNETRAIKKFCQDTRLGDIMAAPVVKIYEKDKLSRALELFLEHKMFHLPVVDKNDKLAGLLSLKYLYKIQSPRKFVEGQEYDMMNVIVDGDTYYPKEVLDQYILKSFIQKNPFCLSPEATLEEAVLKMTQRRIGCIIIVDHQQKVLGMFTEQDLVKLIGKILASS